MNIKEIIRNKGIVIAGPTAVGKTEMSIILAKELEAEIISADASQIYKKLDIGTAKISEGEMDGIKHHLIDVANIGEDYSVGRFEQDANGILAKSENKSVLLVGGTGLYIKAITDGFSVLPSKSADLREMLELERLEDLQNRLKELDMESYCEIDLHNRVRLVRAIEVCMLTGEKFSDLKRKNIKNNNFKFLKIFLTRDRDELYNRIDKRVDLMLSMGFLDEARYIYDNYKEYLYKINAIGYKEFFEYFDGHVTLDVAIDKIKRESRRYAKRQMTWFNKQKDYLIYNLSQESQEEIVVDILKKFKEMK